MEKKNRMWLLLSMIVLVINLYVLFVYFRTLGHFEELFKGFDATKVPSYIFPLLQSRYLFILFALILLGKELLKNRFRNFIINVFFLLLFLLAIRPIYANSLYSVGVKLNSASGHSTTTK
jgi:hypothetical protein